MNVLLKSTDDSTPPVTVPPVTVSECNCIINSELFLSTITITESSCLYQNLSTVIEHSISEKWDFHSFSIFIVMTVIGTNSFVPQRNAIGIPILQEEMVCVRFAWEAL